MTKAIFGYYYLKIFGQQPQIVLFFLFQALNRI